MRSAENILGTQVYHLVLTCGNVHEPRNFAIEILDQVQHLVPFDRACIYFVNENRQINDQYLLGIDKRWVTAYMEYYSKLEDGRYDILKRASEKPTNTTGTAIGIEDWKEEPVTEFIRDYVRPMGIKCTIGFCLNDPDEDIRAMFMLDRKTSCGFSDREIELLQMALPQLNNLYKNFFVYRSSPGNTLDISRAGTTLTRRETEIVTLLCHGFSPSAIAEKLHIAPSTAYKHIEHIYKKFHVSSKQELLVKLLR